MYGLNSDKAGVKIVEIENKFKISSAENWLRNFKVETA